MRIDLYTKIVLTLILLLLMVIVFKPMIQPTAAGVQFSGSMGGFWAFDTNTGDMWVYSTEMGGGGCNRVGKITELGKPLTK